MTEVCQNCQDAFQVSSEEKKLVVLGGTDAIVATFTGALARKCGGISTRAQGELEQRGGQRYADVANIYQEEQKSLCFFTPRHKVHIEDDIANADGALLVVKPHDEREMIDIRIGDLAQLFQRGRAAIVFDDNLQVLPEYLRAPSDRGLSHDKAVNDAEEILNGLGLMTSRIPFIHASILRGVNICEPPTKHGSQPEALRRGHVKVCSDTTVIGAVDTILSTCTRSKIRDHTKPGA